MNTHAVAEQRVPAPPLYTLLLQEGHGRWEAVERKSQQCYLGIGSQCDYLESTNQSKNSMENITMENNEHDCTK